LSYIRGGGFQDFRRATHLDRFRRVADFELDFDFHHVVHLEGDRTLLESFEAFH